MNKNSFLTKVIVALCGSTLFILLFNFLPVWVTAVMATFISVMIFYELAFNASLVSSFPLKIIGFAVSAAIPWIIYSGIGFLWLFVLIFLSAAAAFSVFLVRDENGKSGEIINLIFSESVFQISISLMSPILKVNLGASIIILAFISAWGTDAAAQIAGKAFGKTKFLPSVSPNKTLEGSVSGLVGSTVAITVYSLILRHMHAEFPAGAVILCGILCGVLAELGDLFFSYFKRTAGIKDFGKFIVGHGGVLDRFDSVLFVLPVWYAFITVFRL